MRIAIFHNFLDNIGGAEIVDLILARELKADIYTTNINKEKIQKMGFETDNIFSIGRIPVNAPFKQEFAYWKFRKLNLGRKYDFYIIAGDWAMSGGIHNRPNLWYVYSPTREIWDLYQYTRKYAVPFWQRPIFDLWVIFRRFVNKRDAQKIDRIVSISKNVQARVKKYLNRDSSVIYPPIETEKFHYQKNGNFWLSVSRLITHKRVDIQVKAFKKLPDENLIIIGSYEKSGHFRRYANYIKKIRPKNVELKSWISQKELIEFYANCKGVITTSKDEDFGLVPLEAMASGKPIIAPNEGGYKETIIDVITGRLIDNIDEDKLVEAIKEIGKDPKEYKEACLKQAKRFDVEVFIKKIKEEIER
jgi:glycosyltransferase involved in cell wall biosynthesis